MVSPHDRIADCSRRGVNHVPIVCPHRRANVLALSEAYIGVGGGVLILGFSGSRWTIKFAKGFLGWIVGIGTKLFFLYLLVGVGMTIIAGWNAALTGWTVADPTLPLTSQAERWSSCYSHGRFRIPPLQLWAAPFHSI